MILLTIYIFSWVTTPAISIYLTYHRYLSIVGNRSKLLGFEKAYQTLKLFYFESINEDSTNYTNGVGILLYPIFILTAPIILIISLIPFSHEYYDLFHKDKPKKASIFQRMHKRNHPELYI